MNRFSMLLLLSVFMAAYALAVAPLHSPKGKEQAMKKRMKRPPIPPMPTPMAATAAAVVPPAIKTNRFLFYWDGPPPSLRTTNWMGLTLTNYTVLLGRSLWETNWQRITSTTSTNYLWSGTNRGMLFRLTAEWN